MKKLSIFTIASAIALAIAAAPADAATKKKKGKAKAERTVATQPVFISGYYGCVNSFGVFAAVGAVGCGAVYAVPVAAEGFVAPRASKKS
jgi:hypothetical protein